MNTTPLQLLQETVIWYRTHSRAVSNSGGCFYYIESKTCAVGRCTIDPEGIQNAFGRNTVAMLIVMYNNDFESALKPQYKNLPREVWINIQKFHDQFANWTKNDRLGNNLTIQGKAEYKRLKELFKKETI